MTRHNMDEYMKAWEENNDKRRMFDHAFPCTECPHSSLELFLRGESIHLCKKYEDMPLCDKYKEHFEKYGDFMTDDAFDTYMLSTSPKSD